MENYKGIIISMMVTVIIGIFAVISVCIVVNGAVNYKQMSIGGITATGSATKDFTADLISWGGYFTVEEETTKQAHDQIKKEEEIITKFLLENGVPKEEFEFSPVQIEQLYTQEYNQSGVLVAEHPNGYRLTQNLSISSYDIDKIEGISKDITQLIDQGVDFFSNPPEYYYTKLDELKLEMIETATANAKTRVDIIAENANSNVGELLNASLGVFQITAQNSSLDEYSAEGVFNTSSKYKTASITVKLYYAVE